MTPVALEHVQGTDADAGARRARSCRFSSVLGFMERKVFEFPHIPYLDWLIVGIDIVQ